MRYQKVFAKIWHDEKFYRLSDDAKLLFLYIISSPHSNPLGIYVLPRKYIEADLGWDSKRLSKPLGELFRNGFVRRSETTNLTYVVGHLKYHQPENPNQIKSCLRNIDDLPFDRELFNHIINDLEQFDKPFAKQFAERFAKRLGNCFETVASTISETPSTETEEEEREERLDSASAESSISPDGETDPGPPNEISESHSAANGIPYDEIRRLYNEICEPAGLPVCRFLTDKRRSAIRSCWKQERGRTDDIAWWETYWHHVTHSDFLCGRLPGGRQWRANFDWLIKLGNFIRVREGAYH